ncbi:hypothetical protein [Sphingomonas cynarae]
MQTASPIANESPAVARQKARARSQPKRLELGLRVVGTVTRLPDEVA